MKHSWELNFNWKAESGRSSVETVKKLPLLEFVELTSQG